MNDSNKKTTQDRPEDARVVFDSSSPAARPADAAAKPGLAARLRAAVGDVRLWRAAAFWSVLFFAVVLGAGAILWALLDGRPATELASFFGRYRRGAAESQAPAEPAARRHLDGAPLDAPISEPAPFAVAIDNMVDARPQSGLTEAALVIEAPVEGGITRFLAIFPGDAKTPKIGPVRSARPYFLDWAEEYDAVLVHVGGSPEALEKIAISDIRDLNEYSRGGFFWRDAVRKAPHNVYTSGEKLAAAAAKIWPAAPRALASWLYESDPPLANRPEKVADLEIPAASDRYARGWRYDRATGEYVRIQDGREQLDADGKVVRAKNVVIQFEQVTILDEVGRRRIGTVGKGEAAVATAGRVIRGAWQKDSAGGRTRFLSADGAEIVFHPGTTWIQVVPNGTKLVYE